MIKIESEIVKRNGDTAEVKCLAQVEGYGDDVITEAISAIRGLMNNLKDCDKRVHMAVLAELAADSTILKGDDPKSEDESQFGRAMSKGIIGKGGAN